MKIKFLGASGTVTGSSYILTSDSGQAILIDLGMFQGPSNIEQLNYEPYDYNCSQLSGAILTHAHLDHCGRLPILLQLGYKGDIFMTPATCDLTELSLLDSARLAEENSKRARNGNKKILYDTDLATKTIARFKTVEYRTPLQIGDFNITFRDAGHILGSASLEIIDQKANSNFKKIVFSGDLGNSPEALLEATELIDSSDAVVIESTYGDKLHPKLDPNDILQSEINTIETKGGTLLIPAFSLDRTQELLHMIMHLKKSGQVKSETPIYLDSPMAEKATTIYTHYPKLFNSHIQDDLKIGDPFDFPGLQILENTRDSQDINNQTNPQVIIAGSGMMNGGRILGHAAHFLPIPSTRLLIVGYQGEGTIGRELLEGNKKITIDRNVIQVAATVSDTQAMSSHADQSQLLSWLKNIKNVKKVFITHGDNIPREVLFKKISQDLGITDITLPTQNQEVSF